MYEYLLEFKVSKEFEDNGKEHVFYPVAENEILIAEERINNIFPIELKNFYLEVGYGYFEDTTESFTNLLMSPKQIADFICGEGDYKYAEERDFLKKDEMVFFEVDSNCHIIAKMCGEDVNGIYFGKKQIADNISQFIKNIYKMSSYYINIK